MFTLQASTGVDWTRVGVGVLAALFISAVIATWNLVKGKANKADLIKPEDIVTTPDLDKIVETFDGEIKLINARIDTFVALFGQAVSKTDLIKDMGAAAARGDDRDLRVQKDITELKSDLKLLVEKVSLIDKRLDELPARVASLELTRNQSQK